MSDEYKRNSYDATLSRIETKLDAALKTQDEQASQLGKIWRSLNRLDVRVAGIATVISVLAWLVEMYMYHK